MRMVAALVTFVYSKFPDIGYLLLQMILFQAKIAYKCNDKLQLLTSTKLLAHLVNQFVVDEIVTFDFFLFYYKIQFPSK